MSSVEREETMARNRGPLRLPKWRRWTVYSVSLAVWITGALWLIYRYFMRTEGKFGYKADPLEHWWLIMHAGFSVWAVALFGLLWSIHIVHGWNANWKRWSGGFITGFAFILILTGYSLYYLSEDWRTWTSYTHWILGLAALAVFFIHWLSKAVPKRS